MATEQPESTEFARSITDFHQDETGLHKVTVCWHPREITQTAKEKKYTKILHFLSHDKWETEERRRKLLDSKFTSLHKN